LHGSLSLVVTSGLRSTERGGRSGIWFNLWRSWPFYDFCGCVRAILKSFGYGHNLGTAVGRPKRYKEKHTERGDPASDHCCVGDFQTSRRPARARREDSVSLAPRVQGQHQPGSTAPLPAVYYYRPCTVYHVMAVGCRLSSIQPPQQHHGFLSGSLTAIQ